jgi:branched-chain amino acid transport system substrate-binding protein
MEETPSAHVVPGRIDREAKMLFHQRRALCAVALCAAALLTACSDDDEAAGGGGEPIKIGVNVEMSGPASVLGQAYADAAKLRAKILNEQKGGILGRPIELVVSDNRTDQTEALTLTKELAEREEVVATLGPGTTPTSLAAMGEILKSGVPTFSLGSAKAIVSPADERPNVFKTTPEGDVAAQAIVDDLERRGLKRVGLLSTNNPYGDDGLGAMRALADEGAIDLVGAEKFEEDDSDTTPQLRRLLDANPDALVVWAIPPGAPTVRRDAVEKLDVELPMYFDSGAGAELFLELAGEAANGALLAQPKSLVWDQVRGDDPLAAELNEFGTAYTQAYGEMSGFAGFSWDALGALAAAIERAGSTEPQEVIAALEEMGSYHGVSGTLEFSNDDHAGMSPDDLEIIEVRNRAWVLPVPE